MKLKRIVQNNEIAVYDFHDMKLRFINKWKPIGILFMVAAIVFSVTILSIKPEILISNEGFYAINTKKDTFSTDKLKVYLKELNVKYPSVVYAQAVLETANFSSPIFFENNNLFGMKLAKLRSTTAKGEQYNHAVYDSWRESVLDYALLQCKYMSNITTQDDYMSYLRSVYAEDPVYTLKLTKIINQNK